MSARQCSRKLWLDVNAPELASRSELAQANMKTGQEVGVLARSLLSDSGVLISSAQSDIAAAETKQLLIEKEQDLFEACFQTSELGVRVDVLLAASDGLELTEVKAGSKDKRHHIDDCAIQHFAMSQNGLPPVRTYLAHINSNFVLRRSGDYAGLIKRVDITEKVAERSESVQEWIHAAQATLATSEPLIATGPQCRKPFDCSYKHHCSKNEAKPEHPIQRYPGLKKQTKDELSALAYLDIRDVPQKEALARPDFKPYDRWQAASALQEWRSQELRPLLKAMAYPRYYLDFESISFAIPRWPGTRAWEHIPFQWSVHIEHESGDTEHREFIDLSGESPLKKIAESLTATLGSEGAIPVYSNYEALRIRALSTHCPEHASELNALLPRIVDLLPIFREHYYHPTQNGSFSIKAVLPAVLGKEEAAYDSLEGVKDGRGAQLAYSIASSDGCPESKHQQLRHELLVYCALDTRALLKVVQRLSEDYGSEES